MVKPDKKTAAGLAVVVGVLYLQFPPGIGKYFASRHPLTHFIIGHRTGE